MVFEVSHITIKQLLAGNLALKLMDKPIARVTWHQQPLSLEISCSKGSSVLSQALFCCFFSEDAQIPVILDQKIPHRFVHYKL